MLLWPKNIGKRYAAIHQRKDEAAQAALKKAFPTRKIVAVHSLPINLGGGGIHCTTQQQPELKTK